MVLVCGGTTVTVHVSTSAQSDGVNVPGIVAVTSVTVVVVCGGTTVTVQVSSSAQPDGV